MNGSLIRVCGFCGQKTKTLDAKFCIECGTSFPPDNNYNFNNDYNFNNYYNDDSDNGLQRRIISLMSEQLRQDPHQIAVIPEPIPEPSIIEEPKKKGQDKEYQELEVYAERIHEEYHKLLSVKFDNKMYTFPVTCSFCGKRIYTKVGGKQ